ncbi:glycosyltransferase [Planktomarina temperata]|nr:glycosyltransferase [Planktomarina temperata]
MKHYIFVNSTLSMGGPARVISIWANYLAQSNDKKVELISEDGSESYFSLDPKVHVNARNPAQISTKFNRDFLVHLFNVVKDSGGEEVTVFINKYTHVKYAFLLKFLFRNSKNLRLIYWIHGGTVNLRYKYNSWNKYLIKRTFDNVVALYDDYENDLLNIRRGLRSKIIDSIISYDDTKLLRRIKIMPNPITLQYADNDCDNKKRENLIISTGRLDPIKGFSTLIKAFASCENYLPGWRLIIFGEGAERGNLESLIAELDIKEKVSLPGSYPDIHRELIKAKLFVSSSKQEGMSMSILEALASGLQVICTKTSGGTYLLENGALGKLVPIEDVFALSESIKDICTKYDSLSINQFGVEETVRKFGMDELIPKFESLIND